MKKILILGDKGMLGNAVHKYFSNQKAFKVYNLKNCRWPQNKFKQELLDFDCQFIINCIGSIPQKTNNFGINYSLPVWLSEKLKTKIIHPGTDCEIDDDEYGISKKKASNFILNNSSNTKIIKTSIIGHEINTNYSLLDWFLSSENVVNGFSNVFWNGNTTIQWAKVCFDMINNWKAYSKETIISTKCISKYDLLKTIKEVYKKEIKIKVDPNPEKNKCIKNGAQMISIEEQLLELKTFYHI